MCLADLTRSGGDVGGRHVTAHHIQHDGGVTTAHRRRHRPTSKTHCRLTVSTDVAVSVAGSGRCDIGVPALGSWWFASGCLTPGTTWALSGLVFCNISKQLSLPCSHLLFMYTCKTNLLRPKLSLNIYFFTLILTGIFYFSTE